MKNIFSISTVLQIIIILFQICSYSQTSHVRQARSKIREDFAKDIDINHRLNEFKHLRRDFRVIRQHNNNNNHHQQQQQQHHYHHQNNHKSALPNVRKFGGRSRRWSHRRRLGTIFSPWTAWSKCNPLCKQNRERFCIVKRKCGDMKHIEERNCPIHLCWISTTTVSPLYLPQDKLYTTHPFEHHTILTTPGIATNITPINRNHLTAVLDEDFDDGSDFFIIKNRKKHKKKKKKPIVIKWDDDYYDDGADDAIEDDDDDDYGDYRISEDSKFRHGNNYAENDDHDDEDIEDDYNYNKNKKHNKGRHRRRKHRRRFQQNNNRYNEWDRNDKDIIVDDQEKIIDSDNNNYNITNHRDQTSNQMQIGRLDKNYGKIFQLTTTTTTEATTSTKALKTKNLHQNTDQYNPDLKWFNFQHTSFMQPQLQQPQHQQSLQNQPLQHQQPLQNQPLQQYHPNYHNQHHQQHSHPQIQQPNQQFLQSQHELQLQFQSQSPTHQPSFYDQEQPLNLHQPQQQYQTNTEINYESPVYDNSDSGTFEIHRKEPINTINNNGKEKAVFDVPNRIRRVYSKWSKWTKCSAKCTTRRFKRCRAKHICGNEIVREVAYCYTVGSFCETWISDPLSKYTTAAETVKPQAQNTNTNTNNNNIFNNNYNNNNNNNNLANQNLHNPNNNQNNNHNNNNNNKPNRPYAAQQTAQNRKDSSYLSNSVSNDYFTYGRNLRAPEYTPQNIQCGIPSVRNKPRHRRPMLRIIGGKTSRKGQWPWQVAILNRFKEAFCGGTLISPMWVLTAAHCVRKKLFVRIGEHNLEIEDGTEIEYRIETVIKHPKYDKRTVDNDVAMLKLPKEVQHSMFIGFACLPQIYQPLPKTHQCTIIGWGKQRNTDDAGTNVLHEAEVPIISNEECMNVYYDYTITKNMFCAGHKRGRIDTCAGDSGGPLLCRDTTLPNQPWTIFGITSFGDGCGKRNKFGIYAKLPNYVDWIWSVINCNGNCNSTPLLK